MVTAHTLLESNTHGERLGFKAADKNFYLSRKLPWLKVTRSRSQFFSRDPVLCFFETNRTRVDVFGDSPIFRNLAGEWNLCLQCYGQDQSGTGYPPRKVNYLATSFSRHIAGSVTKKDSRGTSPSKNVSPKEKVIFRSYSVTKNEILVTSLIIGQIAFN